MSALKILRQALYDLEAGKITAEEAQAITDLIENHIVAEDAEAPLDKITAVEAEGYIHTNAEDYLREERSHQIRMNYDKAITATLEAQLHDAAPQLRDALINMLGAFDNAACRLKFPGEFQQEAIASAKEALENAGCPRRLID